MVNENKENLTYSKKSIYCDLKEFHDRNQGALYSYQDFEISGIREFKITTKKVRALQEYEKNRLANELMRIFINGNENDLSNINGYITLNPVINYYESLVKIFKALVENEKELSEKLRKIVIKMMLESSLSEGVKLGLALAPICNIENIEEILDVFSIHNDYIFYVINAYEYIGQNNNCIFELAKKSKGYGKLFSVRSLQPATYDIRKWMIEEGANDNLAVTELLCYSMLSLELLDYLENTKFDKVQIEKFSKSFNMLLSDYGLDEIKDGIKVCYKLLEIIDEINGGIYSLYAVISILYSVEAMVIEYYEEKQTKESLKYIDDYNNIIEHCQKICKKKLWHDIIESEVCNIEIESSVLVGAAEKTGYKLKKKDFELILNRDSTNALLYRYAFSLDNKGIKKYTFNFALKKLPMDKILYGQDELKINNLEYEDIAHICFFIIVKYAQYEEFKEEYKELNLNALRSPVIETRTQAVLNLRRFKEEFDSLDEEIIKDAISTEMVANIRRGLNSLLSKSDKKEKKYVNVSEYADLGIHVKDIYLNSVRIVQTSYIDISEVCNNLLENDIIYLKTEPNNPDDENAIQIVTTQGFVIGYIPKENNVILKNLMDKGKYIYGRIKEISDNYEEIKIDLYLSYKDIIDEITNTLSLLSGTREVYLQ